MAMVLLVEDDEIVRQALIHELTDLGHAERSVVRALDALREATGGHGYDMIDLRRVWRTVVVDLPPFKAACLETLARLTPPEVT